MPDFPLGRDSFQIYQFVFQVRLRDFARVSSKIWLASQTDTLFSINDRFSQNLHQKHKPTNVARIALERQARQFNSEAVT